MNLYFRLLSQHEYGTESLSLRGVCVHIAISMRTCMYGVICVAVFACFVVAVLVGVVVSADVLTIAAAHIRVGATVDTNANASALVGGVASAVTVAAASAPLGAPAPAPLPAPPPHVGGMHGSRPVSTQFALGVAQPSDGAKGQGIQTCLTSLGHDDIKVN